jgi:predicted Zn-dependent protease with MMP-like domain
LLLYFTDNDVILKLAAYQLFWEMVASLNIKDENIRILPTAANVLSRSQKIRRNFKPITIERAKQIANACQTIDDLAIINTNEYQMLASIDGIDVGEALLVAATKSEENFCLLTSDKRFLKTLASSNFNDVKQRLRKRVVCLEQLVLHLIKTREDFDLICRRIVSADSCDLVISDAFQAGRQTKQKDAITILNQAIQDLRAETEELLIDSIEAVISTQSYNN